MSEFISIKSQDQILKRLEELSEAKKGLICLYGKSGSGKSVILERFSRQKMPSKSQKFSKTKNSLKNAYKTWKIRLYSCLMRWVCMKKICLKFYAFIVI
ncbi:TniB family NTP-binding protein [Campylobacter upsaliensis]|nr:TniB family NTP-binding protein [Campylobacter upsaliensis]